MRGDPVKFITGQKYQGRFISNWDSKHIVTIERRTEKSVWVKDIFTGEIVRKSISAYNGAENFKMCSGLGIYADQKVDG